MKENKLTKGWVIKAIIWSIAGCILAAAAWFGWVYDVPQKIKRWFLHLINKR